MLIYLNEPWALKVPMSIPAFLRKFFNQTEIVEDTTGLCGLTKHSKIWEPSSPHLQPSVREIHSSNVLTAQRLGSCVYAWYETVGGASPLLQLLCSLWMSHFFAINLIFRCWIDEALEADDNGIKTVNLHVMSNPFQTTVSYQAYLFSNKPKLFQHSKQMYSEAVVTFDWRHLSVKHRNCGTLK